MANDVKIKIGAKDNTKRAFASMKRNLDGVNTTLIKVTGLIAGVAGVAGFGALVKSSLDAGDALAKTADKIGITTDKLAELHHITSLYTSAGADAMSEALTKATKRLGEFNATGGGAAARWLETLNLDTKELISLQPDELFNRYAESIRGLNSRGEQLAAISALMGDESRALIGIVDQSAESLAKAAQEADALGLSLSRFDTAKMEAANDSFTRFKGITSGIGNTLAVELSPFLEAAANSITKMAIEAGGFGNVATKAMNNVITAVGFVSDTFRGLEFVWVGLKAVFAGLAQGTIENLFAIAEGWRLIANLIPGIDLEPMTQFESIMKSAQDRTSLLLVDLQTLAMQPMPSDNIKLWAEEVVIAADEAAAAVAAAAPGGGTEEENEAKQEAAIAQAETMEQIAQKHQFGLTQIINKGIAERAKFEKLTTISQTRFVLGNLTNLLSQSAQHSEKAFKINKIAGIANAIVNTAEGVTKSLSAYPFPVNAAMAAATFAAGLAQIQTIKSQSFSGGGSVSAPVQTTSVPSLPDQLAGGGSTTAPASSDLLDDASAASPQQTVTVSLPEDGGLISTTAMREFLEQAALVAEDMGPNTKLVFQ